MTKKIQIKKTVSIRENRRSMPGSRGPNYMNDIYSVMKALTGTSGLFAHYQELVEQYDIDSVLKHWLKDHNIVVPSEEIPDKAEKAARMIVSSLLKYGTDSEFRDKYYGKKGIYYYDIYEPGYLIKFVSDNTGEVIKSLIPYYEQHYRYIRSIHQSKKETDDQWNKSSDKDKIGMIVSKIYETLTEWETANPDYALPLKAEPETMEEAKSDANEILRVFMDGDTSLGKSFCSMISVLEDPEKEKWIDDRYLVIRDRLAQGLIF